MKFLNRLKNSKEKQILIYIHGYSNLPKEHIFPRGEMLQTLFNMRGKGLVQVIPLIWPCDNDFGALKDYWDDQKAADASAFAFARVFDSALTSKSVDIEAMEAEAKEKEAKAKAKAKARGFDRVGVG